MVVFSCPSCYHLLFNASWGSASDIAFWFLVFHSLTFTILAIGLRTQETAGDSSYVCRLGPLVFGAEPGATVAALGMMARSFVFAAPAILFGSAVVRLRIGMSAAALTAIGGAVQVVLWGVAYSRLDTNQRIICYAGSAVPGTVLMFAVAALPAPTSVCVAAALPLAAAACLVRSVR